jgi:hypothetical protein
MHAIRELWGRDGLHVYTDLRLSQYRRIINLTTYMWDVDTEEMVRLVLHGGAHMCKWPAVATMLEREAEELGDVGLQTFVDGVHNTRSITSVAATCTETAEGRTDPTWGSFAVQVFADASAIFNATKTNRTVVVHWYIGT